MSEYYRITDKVAGSSMPPKVIKKTGSTFYLGSPDGWTKDSTLSRYLMGDFTVETLSAADARKEFTKK